MCGIVAYLGDENAYPVLIKGLKRLEYRGYDSAGVAILKENDIKATFFVVGQHLNHRPELAPKIVEGGHVLANHTWNHPT